MKTLFKHFIAVTALAFMAGSIEQTYGIPDNEWTYVSPSPGGGYVIVGSTVNLGELSSTSFPTFLSGGGSDIVTLNAGSTATSSGFVIQFNTSNNTFSNFGSVVGTSDEGVEMYGNHNILNNSGAMTAPDYTADIEGNNNVLNNHGTITATSASNGYSIYLIGQNNTINNWGTLSSPYDPFYEESGAHNTFNNWSTVISTGDYGIYSDGSYFTLNNSGAITSATGAQAVYANGGHFTLNNYKEGTITSEGDGVDSFGNNDTINNWGTITSSNTGLYGIYMTGSFSTLNNWGTVSGSYNAVYLEGVSETANNWGTVSAVDYPLFLYGTNNTFNNWGTLTTTYDPVYEDGSHDTLNNMGTITSTAAGPYGVYSDGGFFTLNNWGSIMSGPNYETVYSDGSNFTLNNWGSISSAPSAYPVYVTASENNTINNWGMITSNGGATAISITGTDNTVNLNGHSSTIGALSISGTHNTVNLDFTGLTPANLVALKAQLLAQGVNTGVNTPSVTFTLRGVTYNIDPAIVNFNMSSYQLQGFTPSQAAIGVSLDSLTYNPAPGTSLFALLNAIDTSGNVPGALEELSPQKFEIYGDLAIANANFDVTSIDARLNNLRDGSESIDTSGVGGATVAGLTKEDSSKESKEIQPAAPTPNRWGFFATGNGLFFRGDSHDVDAQEGKANTAGTIAGIDGKVGDHGVLGAVFAYDDSNVTLGSDDSHATIESYTGGLYGSYHNDGFYTNALAAYTRNNYSSTRNIAIPGFPGIAGGSTNGNQYTANLDGGYDWNVTDRVTVGPVAGVQYVHLDVDGFNESGAGAADLAIGSQNMNSLQSRLGARVNFHLATTQTSSAALDLHAAWQHEYLDDSRAIGASFQGLGTLPFAVQTASPKRDAAVVGTGVNFSFHDRLTLFAEYELELWNESYFEQTVNGGARISF